ncbi:hypothetical protein BH10ACI2_BH10ACI2_16100 [soil metagenome]
MRKLIVTWQDKVSRKWFPIGQLISENQTFRFQYLKGALNAEECAGFSPLASFPDFFKTYESTSLFPMFTNRIVPSSRPEFKELINYLHLPSNGDDPFAFLARTGGAKVTDTFEMFAAPNLDQGSYRFSFFAHGLRYLPKSSVERIGELKPQEQLFLMHDMQNPVDANAMAMRTSDNYLVGFCPSYLLDDMIELKESDCEINLCVEQVNNGTTPLQFKFLCHLGYRESDGRIPFSSGRYQPISPLTRNGRLSSENYPIPYKA